MRHIKQTNQVDIGLNSEGKFSIAVHDKFYAVEMYELKLSKGIVFGITDGISNYLESLGGKSPASGTPITTAIGIQHDKIDKNGSIKMLISRSIDYNGGRRFYAFTINQNQATQTLDEDVYVSMKDGVLTYTQFAGPIGPIGRDCLEIVYDVIGSYRATIGSISLEEQHWNFSLNQDGSTAVINGTPILPKDGRPGILKNNIESVYLEYTNTITRKEVDIAVISSAIEKPIRHKDCDDFLNAKLPENLVKYFMDAGKCPGGYCGDANDFKCQAQCRCDVQSFTCVYLQ